MSTRVDLLVDSYLSWIQRSVSARELDSGVHELTTPFLDRHNDHLQIYAEQHAQDLILLTDDGYIIAELKSSGVDSRGPRRQALLEQILGGYGIEMRDSELRATATLDQLGHRLHSLVQAMLSVDDRFVLAQNTVGTIFAEDVARYLDLRDIRYTPRIKFPGKSGLDHMMDFVVPKSTRAPERVVQVVNSTRRDRVENVLFAINDARALRGRDTEYFAVVNNGEVGISSEVLQAFDTYDVKARPWSAKEQLTTELAA
ncbi:DUF1828 domain-containing protein [Actinokineospora sp. NBRC 105648]|uniref:DUF1828 domain-containing protein n=1 Tax=Actinokineospora sp. NBRC 105648 TaxID=3032206 RepID=UPI0024A3256F|nr:DUF1828 domain-containing protein [Actinokineospora sp. NBRC 105648]GLZ41349.1 hypothetical protein Acsp05_49730 [Actinokineospora sp. NBRC 105648]